MFVCFASPNRVPQDDSGGFHKSSHQGCGVCSFMMASPLDCDLRLVQKVIFGCLKSEDDITRLFNFAWICCQMLRDSRLHSPKLLMCDTTQLCRTTTAVQDHHRNSIMVVLQDCYDYEHSKVSSKHDCARKQHTTT